MESMANYFIIRGQESETVFWFENDRTGHCGRKKQEADRRGANAFLKSGHGSTFPAQLEHRIKWKEVVACYLWCPSDLTRL